MLTKCNYLNIVPEIERITIDQSALFIIPKYLKSLFVDHFQITLLIFFRNSSVVLEIAIVHSIVSLWWQINVKKTVYNNEVFGALLTDSWKELDCVCHDIFIAKLNNGLSLPALKMIQDYLQNWKQRTKVGSFYSITADTTSGVPQVSVLGLLLFNTFLCDCSFEDENDYFANYPDDN